MKANLKNLTFTNTTSASEAEISTCQIHGLALKSQAASMSFSLDAVWVDGTIVANDPLILVDRKGLDYVDDFIAGTVASGNELDPNEFLGAANTEIVGATNQLAQQAAQQAESCAVDYLNPDPTAQAKDQGVDYIVQSLETHGDDTAADIIKILNNLEPIVQLL